jgi:hypothetical protein
VWTARGGQADGILLPTVIAGEGGIMHGGETIVQSAWDYRPFYGVLLHAVLNSRGILIQAWIAGCELPLR